MRRVDRRQLAALRRGGGGRERERFAFRLESEPQVHSLRLRFAGPAHECVVESALRSARRRNRRRPGGRFGDRASAFQILSGAARFPSGSVIPCLRNQRDARIARHGPFDELRHDGGAGFELRLTQDKVLHFAFDTVLIDELPARHLIEPQPQRREPVLIGVLHLGLAIEQAREHVVAKRQIARGRDGCEGKRPDEEPACREFGAGELEAAAFMAARHVNDEIARGIHETIGLITIAHSVARPAQLSRHMKLLATAAAFAMAIRTH